MNLDSLNQIKKVDAPPFLFTRIQQRIENVSTAIFPKKLAIGLGFTLVCIIAANVAAIMQKDQTTNHTSSIAVALQMTTSNALYNE